MINTTTYYSLLTKDLTKTQASTAAQPLVTRDTAYFEENIGKVTSVKDLMSDSRLYSYVMKAFGLGDMTYAKALVTKVLEGGTADSNALANTLNDTRYKALAQAFDFSSGTAPGLTNETTVQDVVSKYVRQQTESDIGKRSPGAELALYFRRVAPTITSSYGILADQKILKVVQTALGLSPQMSSASIDVQAAQLNKLVTLSDFQDPVKLDRFIERYTARYDQTNTTTVTPVNALMVSSTSTPGISGDLLLSLANLKLGG